MNVVDIIIVALLLIFVAKGFSNGVFKEGISFVGGIAVIVIAYFLKNPISVFMYQNLPFFKFGGALAGLSVLNIIVYEMLAFLIVATVLLVIYRVLIKITNILETILKITFVFALPSKLLGALIGFVEGVVFIFVILFVCMQFEFTRGFIDESGYGHKILEETPILGEAISPVYDSLKEIYEVADRYKDIEDKKEANLICFDILLKYKVISPENADLLVASNKLDLDGAKEVVDKYWKVG